VPTQR